MQKNQDKDKYLVSQIKEEYKNLSLNYKNIFISLEIQNLQIDPLIIYKLLRSDNCFYTKKLFLAYHLNNNGIKEH